MFEAMLLVCALATPETYQECKARSYEMAHGVVELFPVPASYSFKCVERDFT